MVQKKNVRAYAASIIFDVIYNKQSLDEALTSQLCKAKLTDGRDIALLRELCYGSLRWYHQIHKIILSLLKKPLNTSENIVYALLIVGLYQLLYLRIPDYAAISETVNAARILGKPHAVSLVNGVLRNFLRDKDLILKKLHDTKYSHPAWFIKMLQKSWPNHWEEILNANNAQAPMSLRINTKKITRGKYLGLLAKQNIAANIDKYSTSGITLDKPGDVSDLPGFNEGLFYVQDISSQLAVSLLELAPKQIILDACAAPGGKLTHILEAEDNLAQVVAVDIDNKRIGTIRENLDRLQLNEKVLLITGDARNPEKWWDKIQFDRILLDAPCSATGVIRRHPDIKVLRTKNDIISLQKHQLQILEALWPLLKANGILLYATCSIFPQENTDVVEDFLQQNKDAKEIVINEPWGVETKHGRQIITGENNMDGFYYAKLRKIEP